MVESSGGPRGSRARLVVLLEDEPMVRAMWLRIAAPLGVELLVVETVEQARALLEVERPDLVVCDWHLGPGRTAEELVRDLANGDVPLVVTCGDGRVLERLRASHTVLAKPCHLDEVEAVLAGGRRPTDVAPTRPRRRA